MIKVSMRELGENSPVLSGLPRGLGILGKLTATIPHQNQPTVAFLDFADIDVATSSFLRAGILGFRDQCVRMKSNIFPVLANINQDTIDELRLALAPQGDGVIICNLDSGCNPTSYQIIGSLDEKQIRTLDAIANEGEADASLLKARHQDIETIGTTGWNNRLTALARIALLVEVKRGRTKMYRSVMELT